jgi:subtilisin family serine protease
MATPHVSGVAALVWSHFPSKINVEIRNALGATALDMDTAGRHIAYGFGIAQAKAAFDYLNTASPVAAPTSAPAQATCSGNGASCSNMACCPGFSCHPKRRVCRVA